MFDGFSLMVWLILFIICLWVLSFFLWFRKGMEYISLLAADITPEKITVTRVVQTYLHFWFDGCYLSISSWHYIILVYFIKRATLFQFAFLTFGKKFGAIY